MVFRLIFLVSLLAIAHGQNAIGSHPLSTNNLHLISTIKTQFRFEETSAVTSPVLQIRGSFSASLSDVLSQGSGGEIYLQEPEINASSSNINWNFLLVIFSSLMLLPGSRRIAFYGCFAILIVSIWAQAGTEFQVTLQYPVGYQFSSVRLQLQDGSLSSLGSVSVNSLDVVFKGTDSTFTAENITIGSSLHIDIAGRVSIIDLVLSDSLANITSRNNDVELWFRSGFEFRGPLALTYGGTITIPLNCTFSGNNGYCSDPSALSSLIIRSGQNIIIRWAPLDCNAYANTDVTVPFPTIDSTLPNYSWTYDDARFWESSAAGSTVLAVTNGTNGGIMVDRTAGYPNPLWAVYMTEGVILPFALHPSRNYRISFTYFQDAHPSQNATLNMTVRVWKLSEFGEPSSNLSRMITWPPSDTISPRGSLVAQSTLYARVPTTPTPVTFDFTPNSVASRAYFGFFFTNGIANRFRFSDIKFEILSQTEVTPSTLYDGRSRIAVIPTMPLTLDPNPRTNCPHLQPLLQRWEDASTWGGQVPAVGSSVILPENTKVIVGPCSFRGLYPNITVPTTSELIFADAPIELQVGTIHVYGAFRIGSPTCRLYSKIQITFYGTWADREALDSVKKGIVVYGPSGVIEIFGKQYSPTWTRLAAPAIPGSDRIYLQHPVNWERGQKVLLVTSYMRDQDIDMNEILTIQSVGQGGRLVQFTSFIRYYHHAGPEYQSEVALISRRILLQGDSQSEQLQYGGHVMIMGQGRIAGVELYRMGQYNTLARYPLHFHMMGINPQSYFKDNSVHDSYFRCYTIHGTHEVLVTRNVAFNAIGHCFYIEDGVEENNTITFNLAARVHYIAPVATSGSQFMADMVATPDRILPADSAASGFYISNTINYVQGNAASGGWAGFAVPHFLQPIGLHRYMNYTVKPKDKRVLLFDGNTAHSAGYNFAIFGGCIYSGGRLWYNNQGQLTYNGGRSVGDNKQAVFNITNYKGWLCGQGGNHWGDEVNWMKSEVYDSGRGTTLFGPALVKDSLFGVTNNPVGYPTSNSGMQGFQFYDQWSQAILSNVTFSGYRKHPTITDPNRSTNCLSVLNNGDDSINQGISAVQRISFENCDPEIKVASTTIYNRASSSIIDWDGSVTGVSGGAIIGSWSRFWKAGDDCTYNSDWLTWVCPRSTALDVAYVQVQVANYTGTISTVMGTFTLFGNDTTRSANFTFGQGGFTGPEGEGWYLSFPQGRSPKRITIFPSRLRDTGKVIMALRYPSTTTFTISYRNFYFANPSGNYTQVVGRAAVINPANRFVYTFDGQHLYFTVQNYVEVGGADYLREGVDLWGIDGFASPIIITANCDDSASPGWCDAPYLPLPASIRP